jgi:membrane protease YdiL (CAAX protease family)
MTDLPASRGRLHPLLRVLLFLLATVVLGQVVVGLLLAGGFALVAFLLRPIVPGLVATWMSQLQAGQLPAGLLFLSVVFDLAWIVAVTWIFLRLLNREGWDSLGVGGKGLVSSISLGLVFGTLTFLAVGLLLWITGWASFHWHRPAAELVTMVAVVLAPAASEEIAFRGYILSTLRGWKGWPAAIVLSSVLFSLAHGLNPGLNGLALLNIALAGLAFSLALRWRGSLWLPLGFHFAWNYVQGPVLGFPVSGLMTFGVGPATQLVGPRLWTGGSFGPEGGLAVTVIVAAACAVLWILNRFRSGGKPEP